MSNQPTTRRAMAIDSYGGVEKLTLQTLPVPPVEAGDVLVALDYAGVAVWDAAERAGELDELMRKVNGAPTRFPLIVGSEGAGTVASGDDGVALATQLGADAAVNGRTEDVVAAARAFAPDGVDAALLAAGGEAAEIALSTLKPGGRAAYPVGVEPAPKADDVDVRAFDGDQDADLLSRLDRLVASAPFTVHVARTFPLAQAAAAHQFLDEHFLGKLALKVR